jgi:hypothetical protein
MYYFIILTNPNRSKSNSENKVMALCSKINPHINWVLLRKWQCEQARELTQRTGIIYDLFTNALRQISIPQCLRILYW